MRRSADSSGHAQRRAFYKTRPKERLYQSAIERAQSSWTALSTAAQATALKQPCLPQYAPEKLNFRTNGNALKPRALLYSRQS
jgi:hypothetical protein